MRGFATLKGHLGRVSHIAFSPDSRRVATASSTELNVRIWSVADGSLETAFTFGKASWLKSLGGLAFSPDGDTLYVVVESEIIAWIPATGEVQWRRKVRGYPTLSPDGRVAAVCSGYANDDHLRLFDLECRRYRGPLHEGFSPKAFSPDGRYLRAQNSETEPSETVLIDLATGAIVWRDAHSSRYLFLNASTFAIHRVESQEKPSAVVTLLSLPSLQAYEEPIEFRHWELVGEWSEDTVVTANDGKWCICCSMHDPALRIDREPSGEILTIENGVSMPYPPVKLREGQDEEECSDPPTSRPTAAGSLVRRPTAK